MNEQNHNKKLIELFEKAACFLGYSLPTVYGESADYTFFACISDASEDLMRDVSVDNGYTDDSGNWVPVHPINPLYQDDYRLLNATDSSLQADERLRKLSDMIACAWSFGEAYASSETTSEDVLEYACTFHM